MYRVISLVIIFLFNITSIACALSYSITGLGALGGSYSVANGINNLGQVVGFAYIHNPSTGHGRKSAFLYDETTGMQNIGTLGGYYHMSEANDINDSSQVVGSSYNKNDDLRAFVYDVNTGMKEIVSTGTSSVAYSINNSGKIVGYNSIGLADGKRHAYIYDPLTGAQRIFGGGEIESVAYGINDNGQISGSIRTTSSHMDRAFLYDPITGQYNISVLGRSFANDINNNGQVVGMFVVNGSSVLHPFYYDDANGMQDIGILGGSGSYATAKGINDSGQTVGYSTFSGGSGYHAFLYDEIYGLQDLNNLVDDDLWTIIKANDINQSGQIVGYGIYNGNHQAFLMTPDIDPVPEPATLLLLGSGLAGLAFYRRKKKF